jgi:hypothetical protein
VSLFPITWDVARRGGPLVWDLLARVSSFCEDMDTQDSGRDVAKEITDSLMMQYPSTVAWVALDESDRIILHMVASIREHSGSRWVEITQYQKDGDVPEEMLQEGFRRVEEWGKAFGCTQIRLATLCEGSRGRFTSPRARLFEGGYGFRPFRLVMAKEIGNEVG